MLKMTVYFDHIDSRESSLMRIMRYAREQRLFIYSVTFDDDRNYTRSGNPGTFSVTALLMDEQELNERLEADEKEIDDIPF